MLFYADGKKEYVLKFKKENLVTSQSGNIILATDVKTSLVECMVNYADNLCRWNRYSSATGQGITVFNDNGGVLSEKTVTVRYSYYSEVSEFQ